MADILAIFTDPNGVKNTPFEITTHLSDMSIDETQALALKLVDSLVHLKDESGSFRVPLPNGGFKVDSKSWNNWEWTQGVGLYGMWVLFEITGDESVLGHIKDWFAFQFKKGTPTKNVNSMAPMLTLAYLYEHTGEIKYKAYLESWAEFIMHGIPRTVERGIQHITFRQANEQQLWDDTLMMSVLPLAKIGVLLNRPEYVEEAKRQFLIHIKYLVDRRTGLWFHGWTFLERHHFGEALWGRGNSWVTIAIPEFLELLQLPADDNLRVFLESTLEQQVAALKKYQSPSGLWHTLIDDADSYLEVSASAGFSYGILKGVRLGYLSEEYREVGMKGLEGVVNNVNEKGVVENVSFGTPMGADKEFYRKIRLTAMPYGQAMTLLSVVERLRQYL
ncbi:family 88 glycosyl hydrolase [Myxozyma melibiosi]|uniref:Family 88 glycosyl hydrolase n=1 Tax=Myxozyma melibiosi TaxID=54550 RepID=A0ABR1F3Q9_9ASCO